MPMTLSNRPVTELNFAAFDMVHQFFHLQENWSKWRDVSAIHYSRRLAIAYDGCFTHVTYTIAFLEHGEASFRFSSVGHVMSVTQC